MVAYPYFDTLFALWLFWLAYWIASAVFERATNRAKETRRRVRGTGYLFIVLLLFMLSPLGFTGVFGMMFYFPSAGLKAFGLLLTASGVGLGIWARRRLGSNWSAVPALKEGHTLVTTGPYSLVRHPIYTGILTGLVGSAIVLGTYGSLVAMGLSVLIVVIRVRQEEGLLREQFGQEYDDYRKRSKAIVPWLL